MAKKRTNKGKKAGVGRSKKKKVTARGTVAPAVKATKRSKSSVATAAAAKRKGKKARRSTSKGGSQSKGAAPRSKRAAPRKGPATLSRATARKGSVAPQRSPGARGPAAVSRVAAKKKTAPVGRADVLKQSPGGKRPIARRDGAGHLDPKYAADLRRKSGKAPDDGVAFLGGPHAKDDLAESLGEQFVETATTGEDEGEEFLAQEVPEEVGGPFVPSTAGLEFADGPDPSNPPGAKREPFPTT
jgi:hypothetical protein